MFQTVAKIMDQFNIGGDQNDNGFFGNSGSGSGKSGMFGGSNDQAFSQGSSYLKKYAGTDDNSNTNGRTQKQSGKFDQSENSNSFNDLWGNDYYSKYNQ